MRTYQFRHALYRRIAEGRRARLHRAIGLHLEAAYGDRAPEMAAELALHFERGREASQAVSHRREAAANALARGACPEARGARARPPGSPRSGTEPGEARFHRAVQAARRQGARALELRAAMSLTRLWRHQGRRAEARELLVPVYAWFTEGLDTADLREARALAETLG
jgi:hypothetical protein